MDWRVGDPAVLKHMLLDESLMFGFYQKMRTLGAVVPVLRGKSYSLWILDEHVVPQMKFNKFFLKLNVKFILKVSSYRQCPKAHFV